MARFDIDTGGYPVQRRAKIACCGFNCPDIRNPLFREPELKLYRRIINRKMRRGGLSENTPVSAQSATALPVRQSGTIPMPDRLPALRIYRRTVSACTAPAPVA